MADQTPLKTSSGTLAQFVTGDTVPIANGGTGQTAAATAINALLPSQTSNSGKYLTTDGTNPSWGSVSSSSSLDVLYSYRTCA